MVLLICCYVFKFSLLRYICTTDLSKRGIHLSYLIPDHIKECVLDSSFPLEVEQNLLNYDVLNSVALQVVGRNIPTNVIAHIQTIGYAYS
jgi:hypothetical protein